MFSQSFLQLQVLMAIAPALAGWVLMLPASQPFIAQAIAIVSQTPAMRPSTVPVQAKYPLASVPRARFVNKTTVHNPEEAEPVAVTIAARCEVLPATDTIRATQASRAP